jgi:hypothetical protein
MGSGDVVPEPRLEPGLVIGSPVEIYTTRGEAWDEVREENRALPDRVVAKAIVGRVRAPSRSSPTRRSS